MRDVANVGLVGFIAPRWSRRRLDGRNPLIPRAVRKQSVLSVILSCRRTWRLMQGRQDLWARNSMLAEGSAWTRALNHGCYCVLTDDDLSCRPVSKSRCLLALKSTTVFRVMHIIHCCLPASRASCKCSTNAQRPSPCPIRNEEANSSPLIPDQEIPPPSWPCPAPPAASTAPGPPRWWRL